MERLVLQQQVSPDVSLVVAHVSGRVEFAPVEATLGSNGGGATFALYGLVGLGVVHTRESLRAIDCAGLGPCVVSPAAVQLHPSTALGLGLRVQRQRLLARLELRDVSHVETWADASLSVEHLALTELSVGLLLGRRPTAPSPAVSGR